MVSWLSLMKLVGVCLIVLVVVWSIFVSNICLGIFVGLIMFGGLFFFIRYFNREFQPDNP